MSGQDPKSKLLAKALDHALAVGIGELSLRQIAEAIGTSHRMLLYHFGSREGLLTAVTNAVEAAERERFLEGPAPSSPRALWAHLSEPSKRPQECLFFEIYAQALRHERGTDGFLEHVVDDWVEPVSARLVAAGVAPDEAGAQARLGLAVVRGLLLDLLATGDLAGTTAAFDLYLDRVVRSPRPST
jgi:AcrR family transcriptional regulator